jgi:ribosomal protein S27E
MRMIQQGGAVLYQCPACGHMIYAEPDMDIECNKCGVNPIIYSLRVNEQLCSAFQQGAKV